MKHHKELDGVRGLAAIMVMFFHFFQYHGVHGSVIKNAVQKMSIFGQTGVTLFFVLSGFLITRILLKTKSENNFFKAFYARRVLRIFPLYYLFLIIYYFVLPALTNGAVAPFAQQWYYWVYLQNFALTFNWANTGPNHFWSLAVEEHFYFFWPLIVYFLPAKKVVTAAWSLIVVSFITRMVLLNAGYGVFYFTFTNLDALVAGALLATRENKYGLQSFKAKKFAYLLGALLLPTLVMWVFTGGKSLAAVQALKFPLIAFVYYALIGLIISTGQRKVTAALFKNKPILYAGKISYGLYVYHPLIFLYYSAYYTTGYVVLDMAICFAAALLAATASYYLFEVKILYFKKYFEYGAKAGSLDDAALQPVLAKPGSVVQ